MSQILNTILGQDEENDGVLTQQDTETVAPASPPATDGTGGGDTGGGNTGSGTGNGGGNTDGGTQNTGSVVPAPAKKEEQPTHFSYLELTKQMNPYKAPTQEELEKERKKQKRDKIFAAIGDGLSAFHVAYANAYGTKPIVDIRNSMSGKVRNRYEQLQKERDAKKMEYMNAYLRAQQLDDEAARDQRNWKRQLERDKVADNRDKRDFDNRVKQQEVQQQQWQQSFDRQGEQWQKQFEESKRQHNASNSLQWASLRQQERHFQEQERRNDGQLRGKPLQFSDTHGTFTVYKNVWDSNWPQIFDVIVQHKYKERFGNEEPSDVAKSNFLDTYSKMSPTQKETFAKSNWGKYDDSRYMMRNLADIDPAGKYDSKSTSANNTPPSRRNNNNNTPPSKRK